MDKHYRWPDGIESPGGGAQPQPSLPLPPPIQALGVDTRTLMLVQPDCGEQALEVADQLARCGEIGMIVVDSVSALVPKYVCLGGGRWQGRLI